jgi:hypothetical protein
VLAVVGIVIPYSQFVPWLVGHGLDAKAFALELFSTRIGAFFGLDVLIAALVLLVFIRREGRRARVRHLWLPAAATLLVGVSCGLPLFLFMRERAIDIGGK